LFAPADEHCIGCDHERVGSQLGEGCKYRVEVVLGAGIQDMELQPEGAGSRLQVSRYALCCWEADTKQLRYAQGIRPAKSRNMAIAEWPTASGPADYALFVGTKLVGVVEVKRRRKNVSAAVDQAERYSTGVSQPDGAEFAGGPWGNYRVPFVFAANGRSYLKQIETESGIWFRDTRLPTNHRRAIVDWPTPEGLIGRLEIDKNAAAAALRTQPFEFGFPLRYYQREAIEALEAGLAADKRSMLVAMATGTGKTKLAIALLYRLITAKRFRRVCFVVDRSALGHQTAGEFTTTKIVSGKTFAEIFGLKELQDISPETETKVHICTIQGLVRRVLYQPDVSDAPPVDQYDLIVVDECHRGYLLDREMTDAELSFRSQEDYISKYRRVLECRSLFCRVADDFAYIPELSADSKECDNKRVCNLSA
jgi:type I restriction enzyme R subunit